MSVKSSGSMCGEQPAASDVIRIGCLRKLKTMRKKFFVLRADTVDSSARLEYYDTEKKYRQNHQPKRSISLKACFNINKRVDTKHKHVIAFYTKDDCFCIVLDSERDLEEWLKALLSLQRGEDVVDGEPPKPTFEHVWQVTMLNKGLGSSRNILGPYHLCFTDKTLSLVRKTTSSFGLGSNHHTSGNPSDYVEFSLMSIRRCGHSECFFYMEVGRSAVTGAGELWMQTEDTNIAQNMGEVILRAMSNNNNKEDLLPKPRTRSSSANEASKPILVQRRHTQSGQKSTSYCSPSQTESGFVMLQPHIVVHQRPGPTIRPSQRRHSVSAGATVSWSGIVHHQRTQSLPLAPQVTHQTPHVENNNYGNIPRPINKRCNNNYAQTKCMARERCDSMPSRARTSSESTPPVPVHPIKAAHLIPHRPQSLYGREISHSPSAGSPVSPASAACSTDSAGSSLSIDEPDAWTEYAETNIRYGHSLTPDEPIVEGDESTENSYPSISPALGSPINCTGSYAPRAAVSSDDGYVDMSPRGRHIDMSPAASSCSITSGTPSTDMRFSEYHLEKVSSYFTPSEEDDTSSAERPLRAYSVGSRPDVLKIGRKLDASLVNHDNSRVRAFSVGSQSKSIHNRVLHHHRHPPSTGGKSSSAPLLSGSNSHLSSQSSMERMDDLMEMDFSKPPTQDLSGYMDMSPRNRSVPPGYVEMKPGVVDIPTSTADIPYMDMKPCASPVRPSSFSGLLQPKTNEQSAYVDMQAGSITSPSKPPTSVSLACTSVSSRDSGYMDMRVSTSPHRPSTLQKYPHYIEMSANTKLSTSPKNNNKAATSPIQEEYIDMDFNSSKNIPRTNKTLFGAARTQPVDLPYPKKVAEGYMDMSWNKHHQRKSSLDSAKVNVNSGGEDYVNMSSTATSSSTAAAAKKKERKISKKDKNRSQPITIQASGSNKVVTSQSPVSSLTSFLQSSGRKNSTETPPKHPPPNFLPLSSSSYSPGSSPFSSLRKPRSRKNSRRDSRENNSGLITPTSETSTIFPFSPGSPIKPFQATSPDFGSSRKSLNEACNVATKLSQNQNKPPQAEPDYAQMSYDFANKVSSDYMEMHLKSLNSPSQKENIRQPTNQNQVIDSAYVNFFPVGAPKQRNISNSSDDYGEYAVMRPVSIIPSSDNCVCKGSTSFATTNHSTVPTKQLSTLSLNNVKPCVFKPIADPRDDNNRSRVVNPLKLENRSETESSNGSQDEPSSSNSESNNEGSNYETLRAGSCTSPITKLSRPNSVNSENFTKTNSRPGSVSSDKSASRPSSVSSEITKGSLSRPSSVSSELGSTSSTIVGGSRPGSVNAEAMTRPASVSSERELHYASLDLAPTEDTDGTRSPRNARTQEATRSPTPSASTTEQPIFTYAEIDFIKSEEMKQSGNAAVANNKVKH